MFLLQHALPGLLVAALLSGVVAFAGRLWRANNWGDAVALAMGYAGGHAVTIGWPPFPASEATQWLPYVALATMFVGVLDTLLRPPGMLRALVWICYCAGLLRLLLSPKFQYGWSLLEGVFWIAALALGMLILASFLDAAVRRDKSVSAHPDDRGLRHGSRPDALRQRAVGTDGDRPYSCPGGHPGRDLPVPEIHRGTCYCSGRRCNPRQPLAYGFLLCGASLSQCSAACGSTIARVSAHFLQ